MKTKRLYFFILGVVILFAMFNLRMVHVKGDQKLSLYNALLQMKPLETLAEAEVFPENFPEDPWENGGGSGARLRKVTNYYAYRYVKSGNYFIEYTTPITEVDCIAEGEIPCVIGLYVGDEKLTRIVTEDEKRN